jgi:ABC-type oligopeptide transport system ATPase subunit
MTKIINLIGSSGSGKSTTASGLFNKMKMSHYKVELIHEYAKILTWEENHAKLANQCLILGKQSFAQDRLIGKVDFVISDSPLILSPIYTKPNYPQSIKQFSIDLFNSYNNINFFIRRVKPFVKLGRNENEEESNKIAVLIKELLQEQKIPFFEVAGDEQAPEIILDMIKEMK